MNSPRRYLTVVVVVWLFLGALVSTRLLNSVSLFFNPNQNSDFTFKSTTQKLRRKIEIPFNCTKFDETKKCPQNHPTIDLPSSGTCPEYFRWIYEDLRPWIHTGITREMLDRAPEDDVYFKLVIVNGRVYVKQLINGYQTRDVFTIYGIVQLLRRYPGKLPDLELMFNCDDFPVIKSSNYSRPGDPPPPPLFSYDGDDETLDIVFPDWSFWGWVEDNIKPWEQLLHDLEEGNKRSKWMERKPYAYWKGNPETAEIREDLMKCNVSDKQDWGARLYAVDWPKEKHQGFKHSDLASQCTSRFKIYVEGTAWSISEKYILACNSVALFVESIYYDFFTRGLMPMQHYWPIKNDDKCRSIKFAVDWGNNNTQKARDIGKAGSEFVREQVKMDYVYDYMYHLLNEYAKLLKFKPVVPEGGVEFCSENMACPAQGLRKTFMVQSMVKSPSDTAPCTMPPPYDPVSLQAFLKTKENAIAQVDQWEKQYWESKGNIYSKPVKSTSDGHRRKPRKKWWAFKQKPRVTA